MLFCLRGLKPADGVERRALLKIAFWSLQHRPGADGAAHAAAARHRCSCCAAIEHGYWYARSAEFMQQPIIQTAGLDARAGRHDLQRRRAGLAWFVLRLWVAPKRATSCREARAGQSLTRDAAARIRHSMHR